MKIEGPRLSPGKGRWPRSEAKRETRRRKLEKATDYKRSIEAMGGFNRSRGAASRCVSVKLSEAERAELLAKYGDHGADVAAE